jgi:hypothetical protein
VIDRHATLDEIRKAGVDGPLPERIMCELPGYRLKASYSVVTAPNKLRDAAIADRRSAPWTDLQRRPNPCFASLAPRQRVAA